MTCAPEHRFSTSWTLQRFWLFDHFKTSSTKDMTTSGSKQSSLSRFYFTECLLADWTIWLVRCWWLNLAKRTWLNLVFNGWCICISSTIEEWDQSFNISRTGACISDYWLDESIVRILNSNWINYTSGSWPWHKTIARVCQINDWNIGCHNLLNKVIAY